MCDQVQTYKLVSMKRSRCDLEKDQSSFPMPPMKKRQGETLPPAPLCPHEFITQKSSGKTVPSLEVEGFFHEYTDGELEAYTCESTKAVRNSDISKLRSLHDEGKSLQCSNAFGESLLHIACRRGSHEIVSFFLNDANVDVQCRDDFGRTPLHDACWSSEPNFEVVDLLISQCPTLLLMSDKRGHAPLQYTRREHWPKWISFLEKRIETIKGL